MGILQVSLPDSMTDWIDEQVRSGAQRSASDYLRTIVRRDREYRDPNHVLTLEELRHVIEESEASGVSDKSVEQVFEEAQAAVEKRRGRFA